MPSQSMTGFVDIGTLLCNTVKFYCSGSPRINSMLVCDFSFFQVCNFVLGSSFPARR